MNLFACALLVLALAGSPAASGTPGATAVLSVDSLDELKKDIAAKEGALDDSTSVEFGTRALKLAKAAADAAARADALRISYSLRVKKASAELIKLREDIWDLVIEQDASEAVLAPLVSQYLTDSARAALLGKRSKLPEIKAACAFVPLGAAMKRSDRSDKESKELAEALRSFTKEFGLVVDPRRKLAWSSVCDDLLYQLENLSIGSTVGEIDAADTSGVKFKLSDYRGKVVLLDFWGHW